MSKLRIREFLKDQWYGLAIGICLSLIVYMFINLVKSIIGGRL